MEELFRMNDERAARIAAKRNGKARERMPLFADQLEEITAEQVKAAADRHAAAFARCCRELLACGEMYRAKVREKVSAEEFAAMERRRAVLPDGPEYHADFWRRQWQAINPGPEGSPDA